MNMKEEKALKALADLRKALRGALSEEELTEANKKEIEYGADVLAKMAEEMNEVSLLCVLESFRECKPDIILEVVRFSKYLNGLLDIFGTDATEEMLKLAMPRMIARLSKRAKDIEKEKKTEKDLEEIDSLVKRINEGEPRCDKEDDVEETLKRMGFKFSVVDLSEKDDEDD